MQNFGQIENGSIFRIFGSVRNLALKISHRDYFKWIPCTQISLDAKFWPNPEWLHFKDFWLRESSSFKNQPWGPEESCHTYAFQLCGLWADYDFAVRFMVVSFMGTLCVLWLIVRFMVAAVRFMVNCAFYGYCAFYGLYTFLQK